MAVLPGNYAIPLLGVSIFIATLTYITYKLLSDYLHKWFEMKPIPQVEGTYPFIGNALQFKTNAGGKKAIYVQIAKSQTIRYRGTHIIQHFKSTGISDVLITSFQSSFVKFRIIPVSSGMHRCLNSGLDQFHLWFCFMLKLLRYSGGQLHIYNSKYTVRVQWGRGVSSGVCRREGSRYY